MLVIGEVKLNRARIDLAALKAKAEKLLSSYPGYHVEWLALGLEDIGAYVRYHPSDIWGIRSRFRQKSGHVPAFSIIGKNRYYPRIIKQV
jgi:hypothetical protein